MWLSTVEKLHFDTDSAPNKSKLFSERQCLLQLKYVVEPCILFTWAEALLIVFFTVSSEMHLLTICWKISADTGSISFFFVVFH